MPLVGNDQLTGTSPILESPHLGLVERDCAEDDQPLVRKSHHRHSPRKFAHGHGQVSHDGQQVVVYKGIDGSVLGLNFSNPIEHTGIAMTSLPAFERERVADGIGARNRADADRIVGQLHSVPTVAPTPQPSPSSEPSGLPSSGPPSSGPLSSAPPVSGAPSAVSPP